MHQQLRNGFFRGQDDKSSGGTSLEPNQINNYTLDNDMSEDPTRLEPPIVSIHTAPSNPL